MGLKNHFKEIFNPKGYKNRFEYYKDLFLTTFNLHKKEKSVKITQNEIERLFEGTSLANDAEKTEDVLTGGKADNLKNKEIVNEDEFIRKELKEFLLYKINK
jgi:hypothetical protein